MDYNLLLMLITVYKSKVKIWNMTYPEGGIFDLDL